MAEGGNEARLERIQGGVDLINERLAHSNRIADERHEAMKTEIGQVKDRLHKHGNALQPLVGLPERVDKLEEADTLREGERRGITNTLKIAWLLGGSGATAVLMAMARKVGLL